MFVDILLLLAGFALVTLGAEGLVEGASGIARKLGISEFVIGLTIVAIGTSAPEMVVSVIGAVEGNSDVCAGNVLGSNIFNSLMVLGITAMAFPVIITKANKKVDLPVYFGFSLLVFLFAKSDTLFGIGSGSITRPMGIIMLVLFATYIFFSFKNQKAPEQEAGSDKKEWKTWIYILLSVLGLGGLVFGGRLFVDSAVSIAKQAGLSDKFIAVTILAIGTSLPEFATNIVAIIKKKSQLALGNILGSNIFNMLLVLGTASTITPISFERMSLIDFGAILLGALVIWSPAFSGRMRISRVEGSCLLLLEAGYLVYIFVNL
ncbi:MAG: calcium/sodium antiporter [Bacteroidales bacterium]|nr:calcium/sodium antiporter [Bacteroidales bacterium]